MNKKNIKNQKLKLIGLIFPCLILVKKILSGMGNAYSTNNTRVAILGIIFILNFLMLCSSGGLSFVWVGGVQWWGWLHDMLGYWRLVLNCSEESNDNTCCVSSTWCWVVERVMTEPSGDWLVVVDKIPADNKGHLLKNYVVFQN